MDHQMKIRFLIWLELALLHTTATLAVMYLYYHFTVTSTQHTRPSRKRSRTIISDAQTRPSRKRSRSIISDASSSCRESVGSNTTDIRNWMRELIESNCTAIREFADKLLQAPPAADEDAAKQTELYNTLAALPELSKDDVIWATRYLANSRGDRLAFYGMPEQVRGRYVLFLLNHRN